MFKAWRMIKKQGHMLTLGKYVGTRRKEGGEVLSGALVNFDLSNSDYALHKVQIRKVYTLLSVEGIGSS